MILYYCFLRWELKNKNLWDIFIETETIKIESTEFERTELERTN
jgi:hypothetical protein